MMTGKRRAELRAQANGLLTIVHIGKDGINENLIKQADDALSAREIIKLRVLESAPLSAREACGHMAKMTRSEPVQVIGSRFVLYRENPEKRNEAVKPAPKTVRPKITKIKKEYKKETKKSYSYPGFKNISDVKKFKKGN